MSESYVLLAEQVKNGVTRYTFGELRYYYDHDEVHGVKTLYTEDDEVVSVYSHPASVDQIHKEAEEHRANALGKLEYQVRVTRDPEGKKLAGQATSWTNMGVAGRVAEKAAREYPGAYVHILVEPHGRSEETHRLLSGEVEADGAGS